MAVLTPPPPRSTPFLQPRGVNPSPRVMVDDPKAEQGPYGTPSISPNAPQVISQPWSGWFRNTYNVLKPGISVVVPPGATLTFENGLLVKVG